MTFKTVDQIHSHLVNLSNKERNITHDILLHLQLFQKISGHIKLGYPTIYAYMIGELKYSNDQAYRRLKAAKLLNTVPEVADKIREGSINLTQAMQLQNAITEKQKQKHDKYNQEIYNIKDIDYNISTISDNLDNNEILKNTISNLVEKIENKNSFDSQRIIAEELQLQASTKDRVKPLSNKTVKLEVHLTDAQYEKLMRVKSKLSHKFPEQNNGDIIEHLCNLLLKEETADRVQNTADKTQNTADTDKKETKTLKSDSKNRGERKADVDLDTKSSAGNIFNELNNLNEINSSLNLQIQEMPPQQQTKRKIRSRHVPVAIRKYVMKRAENKCEFKSKAGHRCNSDFQLEVEHVVPFSQGGSHELNNLKCFCSYHNSYAATQLAIGFETII